MPQANYTLGRGRLFFARFLPDTQDPGPEKYFGNTPEISLTFEVENLDHFNSDEGIREKDDSIALETDRTGTFTTDNISPENLALFFFGDAGALTQTALAAQSEVFPGANIDLGDTVQIGMSAADPAGLRSLALATGGITQATTPTATTLVADQDYRFDGALGRVEFLEGAPNFTPGGEDVTVNYDILASTRDRVISGSTSIAGALRYVAANPKGSNFDYYMPFVELSPNGDYALKGDEWQAIPFSFEILKRAGFEALYVDGRPRVTP